MAATKETAIPDALGLLQYCLNPTGKSKKEPVGERVQYIHSTFLGGNDPQAIKSELKLYSGEKYDGYHLRISFSPDDRKLNEDEFKAFVDRIAGELLPGRAVIAICHSDTAHQHLHLISAFKDDQGRVNHFKGKGKHLRAATRQHAVDALCEEFGLSVLDIPEGDIYRSSLNSPEKGKSRKSLQEVRITESGRESFIKTIRQAVSRAAKSSKDFSSFSELLSRQGITVYERGKNLVFMDSEGRKVRLSKMFSGMVSKSDIEALLLTNNGSPNAGRKESKMDKEYEEYSRRLDQLVSSERQFAESYARRVAVLSERGLSQEEILSKLGSPALAKSDLLSDRWDALKQNRHALEKALPLHELQEMERESREAKYQAQREAEQRQRDARNAGKNFLNELSPAAVLQFGQGDPAALIKAVMSLAPAIPALAAKTKAAAAKAAAKAKEAGESVKAGVGMTLEQGKKLAASIFKKDAPESPAPAKGKEDLEKDEYSENSPSPGR